MTVPGLVPSVISLSIAFFIGCPKIVLLSAWPPPPPPVCLPVWQLSCGLSPPKSKELFHFDSHLKSILDEMRLSKGLLVPRGREGSLILTWNVGLILKPHSCLPPLRGGSSKSHYCPFGRLPFRGEWGRWWECEFRID